MLQSLTSDQRLQLFIQFSHARTLIVQLLLDLASPIRLGIQQLLRLSTALPLRVGLLLCVLQLGLHGLQARRSGLALGDALQTLRLQPRRPATLLVGVLVAQLCDLDIGLLHPLVQLAALLCHRQLLLLGARLQLRAVCQEMLALLSLLPLTLFEGGLALSPGDLALLLLSQISLLVQLDLAPPGVALFLQQCRGQLQLLFARLNISQHRLDLALLAIHVRVQNFAFLLQQRLLLRQRLGQRALLLLAARRDQASGRRLPEPCFSG